LRYGAEVFHAPKSVLKIGLSTNVGDEAIRAAIEIGGRRAGIDCAVDSRLQLGEQISSRLDLLLRSSSTARRMFTFQETDGSKSADD
jgi:hypothetical protein